VLSAEELGKEAAQRLVVRTRTIELDDATNEREARAALAQVRTAIAEFRNNKPQRGRRPTTPRLRNTVAGGALDAAALLLRFDARYCAEALSC
jgi:hypothetical protein